MNEHDSMAPPWPPAGRLKLGMTFFIIGAKASAKEVKIARTQRARSL